MKNILLVIFVVLFVIVLSREEKYTTKYDNINFDQIISSERLLKNYVNCLVDKGFCTPDAKELKRVLPDALATDCRKCSKAQSEGMKKVIHHLIDKKKEWWDELEAKYDPDKVYRKNYHEELLNAEIIN